LSLKTLKKLSTKGLDLQIIKIEG